MDGLNKIYPACELLAVDMAEIMRAALAVDGVIQGCRLAVTNGQLTMSPGRIVIKGRLAEFEADEGSNVAVINTVGVPSGTGNICAVCDLDDNAATPFYVSVLTNNEVSELTTRSGTTSDVNFNVSQGVRFIKLGTVSVGTGGTVSNLNVNNSGYTITSNKKYIDDKISAAQTALNSTISSNQTTNNNRWAETTAWVDYFKKSRWHSNFLLTHTITANGLTVPAGSLKVFKFRAEYGSTVTIQSGTSGTLPSGPNAYVVLKPDGTILSESAGTTSLPSQTTTTVNGHVVPTNINEDKVYLGTLAIQIQNATSGGAGYANCVVQSYYYGSGHICVGVRNIGSTAAKIKLAVKSLYARNIDW